MTQPLSIHSEDSSPRYLDPSAVSFRQHGKILVLTIENEAEWSNVRVVRLFPLSVPQQYLSVRDNDNAEIGLLRNPAELDADSYQVIVAWLDRHYLLPVVKRILSVKERFRTLEWKVETDRGLCGFTTRNPRETAILQLSGRRLLYDINGDRYDVSNIDV